MRIAIATPVYGRPVTTKLFWAGVRRLETQWGAHVVQAFVAGDEPVHERLCKANGGEWLAVPNELGRKFNACTEAAWRWGADYTVILGSDDVISPLLAQKYDQMFTTGIDYFGLRGCYMVEPATRRALYLTGHAHPSRIGETVGAGRTLHRRVLDALEGRPWPDKIQRGADFAMTLKLKREGFAGTDAVIEKHTGAFLLDVKGGVNLWPYDGVAKHAAVTAPADYETVIGVFPEKERAILRLLEGAECPTCNHLRPW